MTDKPVAHRPPSAHHHVESARRQPRPRDHLRQGHGRGRGQVRGLPHHRIAIGQRRRDLPSRRRHRKIPWRHNGDNPNGFPPDFDFDTRADAFCLVPLAAQRLARKPCKELACAVDLALALGQGLAFLARQEGADLGRSRHQLRSDLHQGIMPPLDTCGPPFGLRVPRSGDGAV